MGSGAGILFNGCLFDAEQVDGAEGLSPRILGPNDALPRRKLDLCQFGRRGPHLREGKGVWRGSVEEVRAGFTEAAAWIQQSDPNPYWPSG